VSLGVYLGLGSNIAAEHHIPLALDALRHTFGDLRESRWYRTESIGFQGPDFINLAVAIQSSLAPHQIAEICEAIEYQCGRRRELESGSCSRCIDLDLLLFVGEGEYALPSPRSDIWRFAHVAVPLAELLPNWRHARLDGMTLADYVRRGPLQAQRIQPFLPD
jgi:2-amino-4-hydroxy-6-hydroxymethyldihydropteridine diphosphokinase